MWAEFKFPPINLYNVWPTPAQLAIHAETMDKSLWEKYDDNDSLQSHGQRNRSGQPLHSRNPNRQTRLTRLPRKMVLPLLHVAHLQTFKLLSRATLWGLLPL